MPELPEVEFARRCWQRWAKGHRITAVAAPPSRILRPAGPRALAQLVGARVVRVNRRGKNLLVTADKSGERWGLRSHFGMTGKWVRRAAGAPAPSYARARIRLDDDHELIYCDMRMFGRLQVVDNAAFDTVAEVAALGPDPLADGVDVARLRARLAKARTPIKVALLDQSVLAGVGNIQASESLFRARIDPRRPARSLTPPEARRLATAIAASIRDTLRDFQRAHGRNGDIAYVEEPGTPNPFVVYDRAGERCPRCRRGTITHIVQAGRSTFLCPNCQA